MNTFKNTKIFQGKINLQKSLWPDRSPENPLRPYSQWNILLVFAQCLPYPLSQCPLYFLFSTWKSHITSLFPTFHQNPAILSTSESVSSVPVFLFPIGIVWSEKKKQHFERIGISPSTHEPRFDTWCYEEDGNAHECDGVGRSLVTGCVSVFDCTLHPLVLSVTWRSCESNCCWQDASCGVVLRMRATSFIQFHTTTTT